ncbi:MAG: mannitol dehydrogenase family protein [Paracoccus sp. (in: a-proteobacteria)]|uniref:mannitol dehydrogenase family protein n=1 Tax=Paracoccus sp. TaxID=267 RepID=UPI0039E6C3DF
MILQFGTSRFLQAHVDLFLHEAREAGQDVPPVMVIQGSGPGSGGAARAGRVAAFGAPQGYPVIIRGLQDGRPVERRVQVKSVAGGLSVATDWPRILRFFIHEARFVVSNTGDAGYAPHPADAGRGLGAQAPLSSFPARLAQLLRARFAAGGAGLVILPCELVQGNGPVLRGLVRGIAQAEGGAPEFLDWLDREVIFANTLVDRIVSEPIEPVGAVAEPYALWAVERVPGLVMPCTHPAIQLADSIEPHERLKLHILNLGHSYLAQLWLDGVRPTQETVRQILADPAIRARLDALYADEVLPGFAARGLGDQARAYVDATMARFLNPFLAHRISDISDNHALKVRRRMRAFLDWAGTPAPVLAAIIKRNAA